jgi:two-component system, NtrC family, response regulator AtoC
VSERFTILVADGSAESAIGDRIAQRGHRVVVAHTGAEALRLQEEHRPDLVLVLLPMPDIRGQTLLEALRGRDDGTAVVVTGSDETIDGALDALDAGAQDYVADPFRQTTRLLSTIGLAVGARDSDLQLRYLRWKEAEEGAGWQTLIGESEPMQRVLSLVRAVCRRTSAGGATPIMLLTGETGTGKGMLARCIHHHSARRARPFVDVNCAAIPATLVEAELFGYERGAFSPARGSRGWASSRRPRAARSSSTRSPRSASICRPSSSPPSRRRRCAASARRGTRPSTCRSSARRTAISPRWSRRASSGRISITAST